MGKARLREPWHTAGALGTGRATPPVTEGLRKRRNEERRTRDECMPMRTAIGMAPNTGKAGRCPTVPMAPGIVRVDGWLCQRCPRAW